MVDDSGQSTQAHLPDPVDPFAFMPAGGETGALVRANDWSAHSLGQPSTWSPTLKTLLGIMFGSEQPMSLSWGPDQIRFYNDAYLPSLIPGEHPSSFGQAGPNVLTENALKGALLRAETARNELHSFFMQAPVPMCMLEGPEHRFTLANPPYERFVNRQVTGKTLREAFSQGEADYYIPILDGVYLTGLPYIGKEFPLQLADDSGRMQQLWIDVSYHPFQDVHGRTKGVLALVHDVTDQVKSRMRLEKSQRELATEKQKLEVMVARAPAAIALFRGPTHIFEMINDEWLTIVGRQREYLGKTYSEAIPELADTEYPRLLTKVYETGETFLAEGMQARLEVRPGQIEDGYYNFSYVRVLDGDGKPYGIFCHAVNVTDQVLIRRRLEESAHQLMRTVDKLREEREVREKFVATLTHDLRTPLTAIKMSAQLITRRGDASEPLVKAAQRIAKTIDRADGMVGNLLDANQIRAGERLHLSMEACDLNSIAKKTIDELSAMHGERFKLRDSEAVHGYWNRDGIRRILENLCSNGIKYGDGSESITLGIRKEADTVEISVHNEGPAIPQDEQATLFDPFRRSIAAKFGQQKGWGLGLTLVKGLTQAHGGEVKLESEPGRGTTFRIRLPLDSRAAATA